jgi:hypothetical protein
VELALLALWYVCGLGAAVFASSAPVRMVPAAVGAASFAVVTWGVDPGRLVAVSVVGPAVASTAAFQIVRAVSPTLSAAMAGVLAGARTGVLESQGVPAIVAPVIAASVPVSAAWLARRHHAFAPARLRDAGCCS